MKERPILFSAPMVRALLEGRKTQTRRIAKNRKHPDFGCDMAPSELIKEQQHVIERACPYGQPGDRLWVKETWRVGKPHDNKPGRDIWPRADGKGVTVLYEAGGWLDKGGNMIYPDDEPMPRWAGRYRHSRFMPRWASRILLEITEIRVERLRDISEADAKAEGVLITDEWTGCADDLDGSYVKAYSFLWDSIKGAGSWDANPWVWVVEFKMVLVPDEETKA
jgi:hypothetical protein